MIYGFFVAVSAEHQGGAIRVSITTPSGGGVTLLMLPDMADGLAAALAEQVCQALDACEAWTAAGVDALTAHANGASR